MMNVSLFISCLADKSYPSVGMNVVGVLRGYGVEVDFPMDQTCCGQPAYNTRYQKEAIGASSSQDFSFTS